MSKFIEEFSEVQRRVHKNAVDHGWWEEHRNKGELLCLMHSEISEAMEAIRRKKPKLSEKIPKFLEVEEELADVIIRIMDMSEYYGYNISSAVLHKHLYNINREYKHGGKRF